MTFHALGVGFVAVGVFEEYSVAAAESGLAGPKRIPGETDAGSGVEEMALRAADGNAAHATLHQAVEQVT